MSLVDLVLPPAREQEKKQQGDAVTTTAQPAPTRSSSYTDQQPSPKVQSRDSIDSAVYQEFYAPRSPDDTAPSSSADDLLPSPKKRKTMPMALEDPPALPQRSALRASRTLDSGIKLDSQAQTPHEMYLSSEEEASSSADDFSDYDFDDEDADVEELELGETRVPTRRRSHEDTARVVSVVFSGRPSIVDVSTKRSGSPASVERPRTSVASVSEPMETRRPSTAAGELKMHPPRSSSMMLPPSTDKPRPGFLSTDPFAHEEEDDVPRTPKTPTAAVLRSVSRTFSLVKKRSRPLLDNFSASGSTHNGSTASLHKLERSQTPQSLGSSSNLSEPNSPPGGEFVLHSGPDRARTLPQAQGSQAKRDNSLPLSPPPPPPPPHSPLSPGGKVKGILAMARRRSIHIRAAARV